MATPPDVQNPAQANQSQKRLKISFEIFEFEYVELLKLAKILYQQKVIDPQTGRPMINPQTGQEMKMLEKPNVGSLAKSAAFGTYNRYIMEMQRQQQAQAQQQQNQGLPGTPAADPNLGYPST